MLEVDPKPLSRGPSAIRMFFYWLCGIILFLLVAGSVALLVLQKRFEPFARKWVVAEIQKRYHGDVEIGAFHAALYPVPKVSVEDIVVHFEGRQDLPPLARMRRMSIDTTLWGLRQKPVRISHLTLEGLEISIPPRGQHNQHKKEDTGSEQNTHAAPHSDFVLETVVADGMVLHLAPKSSKKEPPEFEFEKLRLTSAAVDRPMEFSAKLANWKPPGKIDTTGEFGPWDSDEPGNTPLSGKYTFREADLSTFHGISGKLSSDGEYRGQLRRIECSGTTDTPDFRVSVGRPVHLKTEFQAVVDGTNGDTGLNPVTAHFLNSTVVARGNVAKNEAHPGKQINLTVDVQKGRVEDFLHLVMSSGEPVLVGGIAFRAGFVLPPGHTEVIDRLVLKGHLQIPSAHFTNLRVQDILGNVSKRAEGDPKGEVDEHVASSFSSDFVLQNAACSFSRLVFDIPGAEIRLTGSYGIHGGEMDFTGQARTDAKISQMVTGVKSKLLKLVDPFFAKDGAGAVIPIHISGTRNHPKFGLNFHKSKQ